MSALASEPSVVLLVADAVVVEHRDDLLVDAVSDLVDREAGGTDGIASEFERALERLRRGTEVKDVANRLDLSLQALGLGVIAPEPKGFPIEGVAFPGETLGELNVTRPDDAEDNLNG